jgi:rubredoxin
MEIEVYTFKDKDGQEFGTYFTQDIEEAKEYARDNKLRVIANTFVWDDSEEIEDYTEVGHIWMECRRCGAKFDEADGEPTDELGVRLCPTCGSAETYEEEK